MTREMNDATWLTGTQAHDHLVVGRRTQTSLGGLGLI
jgi:hypothetical protein